MAKFTKTVVSYTSTSTMMFVLQRNPTNKKYNHKPPMQNQRNATLCYLSQTLFSKTTTCTHTMISLVRPDLCSIKAAIEGLRGELMVTSQRLEQTETDMKKIIEERQSLIEELDALRREMENERQRQVALEEERRTATEEERRTTLNKRLIEEQELEARLASVENERQETAHTIAQLTTEKDDSSKEFDILASRLEKLTIELEQTKQSLVDNGTDSDSKLKTLEAQLQETLAENAVLSKQQGQGLLRPVTPLNKSVPYSRSTSVGGVSQRSGADYFAHSDSEFSDMGKVITAGEVLFTQRIREHVDHLEQARDHLNQEYQQRFETMLDDKAQREERLELQHTTELEAARNKLRANYAQPVDAGIKKMVPLQYEGHVDELHVEETRLASEHAERLANRRSQIQRQHQSQFQALSDEYDKKMAELLGEKEMLDSDLSIGPERFEEMSEQIDRLHSATQSPASVQRHRPLRSVTSNDYLNQGDRNAHLWRNVETYAPTRSESPGVASPMRPQSADPQGSLRRKTSQSRLGSFMGKISSPFNSTRSSRSSASSSRPGSARPRTGQRVVSTPPPSTRPEYSKHGFSEGASTLGRSSTRPMTAEAREHADMDFSIAPAHFEALQEGKELKSEGLSERRTSAVGVEQQAHKSPKILRHISGSIRKKMSS